MMGLSRSFFNSRRARAAIFLSALTLCFGVNCNNDDARVQDPGAGDTVTAQRRAPKVDLAASPSTVAAGGAATLTWSTSAMRSCTASGAWSGAKATSGSQPTGPLNANSAFILTCTGQWGSGADTATVVVTPADTTPPPPPAPTVSLTADPSDVASGGASTLSWSSANATGCTASGAWSGAKATSGSQSTGPLSATSTFSLSCSGSGGAASQSTTVTVNTSTGGVTGLNFPSNGTTSQDVRFRFTGAALQPMYPATYIWRVNPRQQAGYYTTFFWGPDGAFTGTSYYGAHPYPDGEPKPASAAHHWELSIDGGDFVTDANGHSTAVVYDAWRTQALRVFDNGTNKVHEFYWDLPDTTKVIRVLLDRGYGSTPPANPALTFGDAPWNQGNERLSGILRGMQLYSAALSPANIVAESGAPLSTTAGSGSIWYLNLNPTPDDITDKSGKGHNPAWVTSAHATLWTGP